MEPGQVGHIAALCTAFCWALTAVAFAAAGRRIGSLSLNVVRLSIAFVLLAAWGTVVGTGPLPTGLSGVEWAWLAASALSGFVIGDYCLLRAYAELGPRLTALVMSSAPVWTAVIGWLLLQETLEPKDLLGMTLTVAGIAWAVSSRSDPAGPPKARLKSSPARSAILFAFGGAVGQAAGLVMSKIGMGAHDPFAATQVRVLVGLGGFAVVCTAIGWWGRVGRAIRDRRAMGPALLGGFFGPFLGVALSLLAVQHSPAGTAAAIMGTTPIWLLGWSMWRGEHIGVGGFVGAFLAVGGVAILFS